MFPQTDRDNPVSDPEASQCFADSETIGLVDINDPRKSITRETIDKFVRDADIGVGITDIQSFTGTAHTIHTNIDHGLNRILKLNINSGGTQYGTGGGSEETYYNANLVSIGASTTGTNATAKVTVSAAGTISALTIMDGGSAYGIGNTMHITGITTSGSSGHTPAVVEVQGIYEYVFKKYGAAYEGYPSIVGAGNNACVLHYIENSDDPSETDLMLMDLGAEYEGYTADVTRTLPVKGTFTEEQRLLYQIVYDAQEAGIAKSLVGATTREVTKAT